jgi:hypothetical protein
LPASAVSPDGTIVTGSGTAVALVAATTVTAGLHSNAEQAGLVAGYARWLNGLSGPVQLVVSARRVDLGSRAVRVAERANQLSHPALAAAAVDYAEFLLDLTEQADPLQRTVTIACTGSIRDVQRRAASTTETLAAVGSRCKVLDDTEVTAVLTAATNPFAPGAALTPRTPPTAPVRLAQPWAVRAVSDWDDGHPRLVPGRGHTLTGAPDDLSESEPLLPPWDDDQAGVPANGRGGWAR